MRLQAVSSVLLVLLLAAAPVVHPAAKNQFPFWACSDGKGSVSLFWLPPLGDWPSGGFRLERIAGKKSVVIADSLRPGWDEKAMAAIDPQEAARIRDLDAKIWTGALTDEDKSASISRMGRNAAIDPLYGRALGVRYTDSSRTSGKRVYRLVARDVGGNTLGVMETPEIDPARRTAGPDRPLGFAASPVENGVALSWSDPPASATAPVVAYRIDRGAGRGKTVSLTRIPLVLNRNPGQGIPEYLDADPPDGSVRYEVRSVDIFGRLSQPVRAKISVRKATAKAPPAQPTFTIVQATAAREEVREEPVRSDSAARAAAASGTDLTSSPRPAVVTASAAPAPTALPPASSVPDERGGSPASDVRPRQPDRAAEVGPANPVAAGAAAAAAIAVTQAAPRRAGFQEVSAAPATASELAVPLGRNDGYRRWSAAEPTSDAAASSGNPSALSPVGSAPAASNAPASRENEDGDRRRAQAGPVLTEIPSAPAAAPDPAPPLDRNESYRRLVSAPRPDPQAPAEGDRRGSGDGTATAEPGAGDREPDDGRLRPPRILWAIGQGDRVTISFEPASPPDRTREILVLRSTAPTGLGTVIGRPIPAETRQWDDTSVSAGEYFWYRVVAVDAAGNRSEPSKPRWVAVGSR